MLVSAVSGGRQVGKSVTWPIKPLSECPASSCNSHMGSEGSSTASSTPKPTVTRTDNGNTEITLTGNPLVDLQHLFELFTSSASPFSFPTGLKPETAFQLADSEFGLVGRPGQPCTASNSRATDSFAACQVLTQLGAYHKPHPVQSMACHS